MELRNPKLRDRFENYILALQKPEGFVLTKEFLNSFLNLLIPGLLQISDSPPKFPVPLTAVAKLYDVFPSKFGRLITGRRSDWEVATPEFFEGIDYTVDKSSGELWMTHSCFARASMKLRKARGNQVRIYFSLVDKGLRDVLGSTLAARLLYHTPSDSDEKQPPYSPLGTYGQPGNYNFAWQLKEKNPQFRYSGITDDYNTRMQTHFAMKGGHISDQHFTGDPMPLFKELCKRRYYLDHKVALPDYMRGYDDLFIDDSTQWPKVDKFCEDAVQDLDERWADQVGYSGSPETGYVLPDPSQYPQTREKRKPRVRRASWLHAPVVHYELGSTPRVTIPGPQLHLQRSAPAVIRKHTKKRAMEALKNLDPRDVNEVLASFAKETSSTPVK